MADILNKCPICGNKIEYVALHQYSNIYDVLKSGQLAKKRKKKEDNGSMECGYLSCTNEECNFCTDCDLHSLNHNNIRIFQESNIYMYEVKE